MDFNQGNFKDSPTSSAVSRSLLSTGGSGKAESDAADNRSQCDVPKLPFGHCMVNLRWKGHAMMTETAKYFSVLYTDENQFVDFIPSQNHVVSVLTEPEIVCCVDDTNEIRIKFARLYKLVNKIPRQNLYGMVIYHLTEVTQPLFFKIQTLCVMDFGMSLTPVSSLDSIPPLLDRIKVASRVKNPFKLDRHKLGEANKDKMLVLMSLPGVREHHARTLLGKFGSLSGVARARPAELSAVVGDRLAAGISAFLDRRNNV